MVKGMLKIFCVLIGVLVAFISLIRGFVFFYPSIGKIPNKERREKYAKKSNLYYEDKFHNIEDTIVKEPKYGLNKSHEIVPTKKIPICNIKKFPKPQRNKVTITWLGHSSIMIQMDKKNILIDPVLTKYASPFGFIGVKRFNESPIKLEDVPIIDVLLISHDHYDHLDYKTIKKIDNKVKKYVVPLGIESYLEGWGVDGEKITILNWWEDEKIDNLLVTSVPARHYSMRNPFKDRVTLWSGFLLRSDDVSIYFTGDTGYTTTFREVGKRFGHIDVLMADSGQYNSAWREVHMGPYDALQAAVDVNAKYYIPVHWGSFALSNHNWFDPAEIATANQDEYGVKVITPRIGEMVDMAEIDLYTNKWW